jgi:hypothetical protein
MSGLAACMFATGAFAARLPHIDGVAFKRADDGTYRATIAGTDFGPRPDDIPCRACAPQQMEIANQIQPNDIKIVNVTGWSDTEITVTGINAIPHEALTVAVWSARAANAAAWGGLVSPGRPYPHITGIATRGSGRSLTVTITGRDFGPAPEGLVGRMTDSTYLMLTDYNAAVPNSGTGANGGGYPWQAGFCTKKYCNSVTVGYVSWTPGRIVVSGFGPEYGRDWISNPGDAFCVNVWPSTSKTGGGGAGGNVKCIRLPR